MRPSPLSRIRAATYLYVFALVALALLLIITPDDAFSQARPTVSPTYQPNGILSGSFTAAGTLPYIINGDGTLVLEIGGTGATIVSEVDVSGDRLTPTGAGSTVWTPASCLQIGVGTYTNSITANGLYKCNVAGYAQVRYNLTSLASGTVNAYMSGDNATWTHVPVNYDLGAVITNTAAAASQTINSASFTNLDGAGAMCTFNVSAIVGTPAVTFAIQGFDSASSTWQTLVISSSVATVSTGSIEVYPGIEVASPPTGFLGEQSLHLPKVWRVSEVFGAGSGTPTVTGTIGCNILR